MLFIFHKWIRDIVIFFYPTAKKKEMKSNDDEIDFDDVDLSFGGGGAPSAQDRQRRRRQAIERTIYNPHTLAGFRSQPPLSSSSSVHDKEAYDEGALLSTTSQQKQSSSKRRMKKPSIYKPSSLYASDKDIQKDLEDMMQQALEVMQQQQQQRARQKAPSKQQKPQQTPLGYNTLLTNAHLYNSTIALLPSTWIDNGLVSHSVYSRIHALLGDNFKNIFTWIPNPQTRRGDGILQWKR